MPRDNRASGGRSTMSACRLAHVSEHAGPGFAALKLSVMQMTKDGVRPGISGVEQVLIAEARWPESHLVYLRNRDGPARSASRACGLMYRVDFLISSAESIGRWRAMLRRAVDEWADGDVDGLGLCARKPPEHDGLRRGL